MLVLASASPRRRELLERVGVALAVRPADVDFVPLDDAAIAAYGAAGEWRGKAGAYAIQGIAAALVRAALAHAREQGLKVRPLCSYVQAYVRRHPEVQSLLG